MNIVSATVHLAFEPAALLCDQSADALYCRSAGSPHLMKVNCGRDNQVSTSILVPWTTAPRSVSTPRTAMFIVPLPTGCWSLTARPGRSEPRFPCLRTTGATCSFDPVNNLVFCAGDSASGVLVIDGARNTVFGSIPTGSRLHSLCRGSRGNRVYCAGPGGVSVIDVARNRVLDTIMLARSPRGMMCYDPGANRVICPEAGKSGRVTMIDCATGDTSSFRAGKSPQLSAIDPVGNRFFVLNRLSRDVSVVDPNTLEQSRVAVGEDPVALAVNQSTGRVYVANRNSNTVSVVTDKVLKADIRIEGVKRQHKASAFGAGAVTPIVVLEQHRPDCQRRDRPARDIRHSGPRTPDFRLGPRPGLPLIQSASGS